MNTLKIPQGNDEDYRFIGQNIRGKQSRLGTIAGDLKGILLFCVGKKYLPYSQHKILSFSSFSVLGSLQVFIQQHQKVNRSKNIQLTLNRSSIERKTSYFLRFGISKLKAFFLLSLETVFLFHQLQVRMDDLWDESQMLLPYMFHFVMPNTLTGALICYQYIRHPNMRNFLKREFTA